MASCQARSIVVALASIAGVLVSSPLPAVAQEPSENAAEFEWRAVSRFGGDADGNGRLDPRFGEHALPRLLQRRPIEIRLGKALCNAEGGGRWRLDGRRIVPRVRDDCTFALSVSKGSHVLEARTGPGAAASTRTIAPRDRLIVALGDSVGSGEGNPMTDGPGDRTWLERRCHRSADAGFEQAARLVGDGGDSDTDESVTFVSLACSGATITDGLLGPYAGIEPGSAERTDLVAQAKRLRRIDRVRGVDAVLVSVGANDVYFSKIVKLCIARGKCFDKPFDPAGRAERPGDRLTADAEVGRALAELTGRYDDLQRALAPVVEPERVVLTEYFDPTRDTNGRVCRRGILGGISAEELRWAQEAVLSPLNDAVADAAYRHRWQLAGGISHAFATHGYCSNEPWVRKLTRSFLSHVGSPPSGRIVGTLHPNAPGHLAIAKQVIPPLEAAMEGERAAKAPEPEPKDESGDDEGGWGVLEWGALLLLAISLFALLMATGRRAILLVLPPGGPDPSPGRAAAAQLPRLPQARSLPALVARVGGLIVSVLGLAGFVTLVGAAILWFRFWTLRIPPAEGVAAVDPGQLIVVGAQGLVIYAVLAVLAVIVVWLFDGQGKAIRPTRRGLGILITVELILAIALEQPGHELMLGAGFVVAAFLLHFLVDRLLARPATLRSGESLGTTTLQGLRQTIWPYLVGTPDPPPPWRHVLVSIPIRIAPLAALVGAIYAACEIDPGFERLAVAGLLVLGALLFLVPRGVAGDATEPDHRGLGVARAAVALAAFACVMILIARDEWWLALAGLVATLLAAACLTVAQASGTRFAPYGIAVLLSVVVFGGALACLRAVYSPEAEPVAISVAGGDTYCGIYVGAKDGKLWVARVELPEDVRDNNRRPLARTARLSSIPEDKVVARSIGTLQPVALAQDQALRMRRELIRLHGGHATPVARDCTGTDEEPAPKPSAERELAERYQPELILARDDRFWPVSVSTIFAMRSPHGKPACRRTVGRVCARVTSTAALPWAGGQGEWIEYPAGDDDYKAQSQLMKRALGSADPSRTAREYFLVSGGGEGEPTTLQYWFFYTFNYLRTRASVKGGYHEGDFESVALLLSARTKEPRYVWMARHGPSEARLFTWEEVSKSGRHLRAYVARGSHATYERCGRQSREAAPLKIIDDHTPCLEAQPLRLSPAVTPLTDLSRAPWACWEGRFGHVRDRFFETSLPERVSDGPRGPLFQQGFAGPAASPCEGIADPGSREGDGEEVLPDATAAALREGAAQLTPLVDDCSDWHQAPPAGSLMVVCDAAALKSYVASGFENPGREGAHIDDVAAHPPSPGAVSVPAVRRGPDVPNLRGWRISASTPATVEIYAACRSKRRAIAATFEDVPLRPGQPLRIDDRERTRWRVLAPGGATLATATPRPTRGEGGSLRCRGTGDPD